jgi:hypothetical protein
LAFGRFIFSLLQASSSALPHGPFMTPPWVQTNLKDTVLLKCLHEIENAFEVFYNAAKSKLSLRRFLSFKITV